MNNHPFAISLCFIVILSACVRPAFGEDVKSPDGRYVIHNPDGEDVAGKPWEKQSMSITRKGDVVWSYTYYGKKTDFFWSPDSRRILIALYTAQRDVLLFVLDIDGGDGDSTRLNQISLAAVHEAVLKAYPPRPIGGWAPVTWIEKVRWTSPTECEFHFFDRGEGYDADATVKVSCDPKSGNPPKFTVEHIKDNFEHRHDKQ